MRTVNAGAESVQEAIKALTVRHSEHDTALTSLSIEVGELSDSRVIVAPCSGQLRRLEQVGHPRGAQLVLKLHIGDGGEMCRGLID